MKYLTLLFLFLNACTVVDGFYAGSADSENQSIAEQKKNKANLKATVMVDNSFTSSELDIISDCVQMWNDRTEGQFDLKLIYGTVEGRKAYTIKKIYSDDIDFYRQTIETPRIAVVVDNIHSANKFKAIVLHELGHWGGLEHDFHDEDTVMNSLPEKTYITDRDLDRFQYRWNSKN